MRSRGQLSELRAADLRFTAPEGREFLNRVMGLELTEADLERAIGPETLDHLTQQTGLSRAALLSRLSRELPSAIDRYATDGRRFA